MLNIEIIKNNSGHRVLVKQSFIYRCHTDVPKHRFTLLWGPIP